MLPDWLILGLVFILFVLGVGFVVFCSAVQDCRTAAEDGEERVKQPGRTWFRSWVTSAARRTKAR